MKRSRLKRSSGLKRSRMKRKRDKPRNHEDRDVVTEYLAENYQCELRNLIDPDGFDFAKHYMRNVEPHHIVGRRGDEVCNLIALCRTCHDFIQHSAPYTALILSVKLGKGEFDHERLSEMRGVDVVGQLQNHQANHPEQWNAQCSEALRDLCDHIDGEEI